MTKYKEERLTHQVRAWSRAALIHTEAMFNPSVLRPMFSCKTFFFVFTSYPFLPLSSWSFFLHVSISPLSCFVPKNQA